MKQIQEVQEKEQKIGIKEKEPRKRKVIQIVIFCIAYGANVQE